MRKAEGRGGEEEEEEGREGKRSEAENEGNGGQRGWTKRETSREQSRMTCKETSLTDGSSSSSSPSSQLKLAAETFVWTVKPFIELQITTRPSTSICKMIIFSSQI